MLENIDERLSELENTVGISDDNSTKIDTSEIWKKLSEKGVNFALKVEAEQLRKLKKLLEQPDSRPLSEKLQFIECCADINRKRADLLQEFESRLKVVLNEEELSHIDSYDEQLPAIMEDIESALETWKENTIKIEDFRRDYLAVAFSLQESIENLIEQVEKLERQKKSDSSDA